MKNIFDFATKELSQEAFLRWLFESYADEYIAPCVYSLLKEFCELQAEETIKEISTVAQWKDIDIAVYITTNSRHISLYIEDKVFSLEHDNQLQKYNGFILSAENVYKVYFKTSYLSATERSSVVEAGWVPYDIIAIVQLFKAQTNTNNVILKQYIEHLNSLYRSLSNTRMPKQNNLLLWESYFQNTLIPQLKAVLPNKIDWTVGTYQGAYVYLQGFYAGKKKIPYIELRSRDCYYDAINEANRFLLRLLCYGVEDFSPQMRVIEKIKTDGILSCKNIRKEKPKQIGTSPLRITVANDSDFVNQVSYYAEYYLLLVAEWERQADMYKRIESEAMCAQQITNNDLICKDCLFKEDDTVEGGKTTVCEIYEAKPNKVLKGRSCDKYLKE